jgi:hypothetical protein
MPAFGPRNQLHRAYGATAGLLPRATGRFCEGRQISCPIRGKTGGWINPGHLFTGHSIQHFAPREVRMVPAVAFFCERKVVTAVGGQDTHTAPLVRDLSPARFYVRTRKLRRRTCDHPEPQMNGIG